MTMFKQRGNLTECVQWTGFNLDEVKAFIKLRLNEGLKEVEEIGGLEYIRTELLHLIILINFNITEASVVGGGRVIRRGTWLVDQGQNPENPIGVVFCEPERFKTLYREEEGETENVVEE